jgi:hypothetical protein
MIFADSPVIPGLNRLQAARAALHGPLENKFYLVAL